MARTRIIIGHPAQAGSQPPFVVYLGPSGSEAEAALKADPFAHHYEIFEGPGRRKNNSTYNPTAVRPVNPVTPVTPVTIPEDIKHLKKDELAAALTAAIARIKELEDAAPKAPQQEEQSEGDQDLEHIDS